MIIWLSSYPRSGNTFLRTVLKHSFGISSYSLYDDKYDIASDKTTADIVGHLSHGKTIDDFTLFATQSPESYFVKTHELPSENSKAIYIIREGLSTCVSYKNYLENFGTKTDLRDILLGNVGFGAWHNHVSSWLSRSNNTLYIRYEDLTQNLNDVIDEISMHINRPVMSRMVPAFKELNLVNSRFFRSGNNFANLQEVSESDRSLFEEVAGQLNNQLGYTEHINCSKNQSTPLAETFILSSEVENLNNKS